MNNNQAYQIYNNKKEILEKIIIQKLNLLENLEMKGWVENLENLQETVKSDSFKLLVIGEFKRGKSTFINALLGEEILPSYAKPCTAIINEIKWDEQRRAVLHFDPEGEQGGKSHQEIPIDQIQEYVVIKDGVDQEKAVKNSPYEKAEIFWDLDLCKNGVEIIDSPGLNEHDSRQKVTMDYFSKVDAILFVLTCNALASQSELYVINNILRKAGHEDIFFVCNHFDTIRKKEREDVKEYANSRLAPLTKKGEERIFFISALKALEGRLDEDEDEVIKSGILPLEKDLQEFLIHDRGRVKLLRPAMELRRGISEARRIIPERRVLLKTDVKTLEQKYQDAQKPLQDLEAKRQRINSRVRNFVDDMRFYVRQEAQDFYIQLADQKIQSWTNNYEIKEPIKFLKFQFFTKQIEGVVNEITKFLQEQIKEELNNWQDQKLEPMLTSKFENLKLELDQETADFFEDINSLRLEIAPASFNTKDVTDTNKKVSPLERILATAGGFFIGGAGSATMGAVFGYQEMLKSLIPQLTLLIGGIALGLTNPFTLIPLLMGGGLVQGIFKMKATNNKVKETITKEYIKQIRGMNYEQSVKMADAVCNKLQEFTQPIDRSLAKEIQNVRDQLESVLAEKQKGEANVEQQLQQLETIENNLNKIDDKLSGFINQVALP